MPGPQPDIPKAELERMRQEQMQAEQPTPTSTPTPSGLPAGVQRAKADAWQPPTTTETSRPSPTSKEVLRKAASVEVVKRKIQESPEGTQWKIGDKQYTKSEIINTLESRRTEYIEYIKKREQIEDYLEKLRDKGFEAYVDPETGETIINAPKNMPIEEERYYKTLYAPDFFKYKTSEGKEISQDKALELAERGYKIYQYAVAQKNQPFWTKIFTIVANVFFRPQVAGAFWAEVKEKLEYQYAQISGQSQEQVRKEYQEAQEAEWRRFETQGMVMLGVEEAQTLWNKGDYLGALSKFAPEIIGTATLAASYGIGRYMGGIKAKSLALYGAGGKASKITTAVQAAFTIGLATPLAVQIVTSVKSIIDIESELKKVEKQYDEKIKSAKTESEKRNLERQKEDALDQLKKEQLAQYGTLIVLGTHSLMAFATGAKGYKAGYTKGMAKYFKPETAGVITGTKPTRIFYKPKTGKLSYVREFKYSLRKTPTIGKYKGKPIDITKPYTFRETGFGQVSQKDMLFVTKKGIIYRPKGTLTTKGYILQKKGLFGWRTIKAKTLGITGPETPVKLRITKKPSIRFKPEGYTELSVTEQQARYPLFTKQGEYYPATSFYAKGKTGIPSRQLMQLTERPSASVARRFQQRVAYEAQLPRELPGVGKTITGQAKFRIDLYKYQQPEALLPAKRSILSTKAEMALVRPEQQILLQPKDIQLAERAISQLPTTTPIISPKVVPVTMISPVSVSRVEKMVRPEVETVKATISSQALQPVQQVKVTSAQATKQAQAQKQAVKQAQKLTYAQEAIPAPPTTVLPPIPISVTIPRQPPKKGKPIIPSKKQGYHTYVKEKGRTIKVTKHPLTKRQALGKGVHYTDNTPSRTFYIKKAPKKQELKPEPKYNMTYGMYQYKYRKPYKRGKKKSFSPKYIEKTRYAIDTPGEKKGITVKGLQALEEKRNQQTYQIVPQQPSKMLQKPQKRPSQPKTTLPNIKPLTFKKVNYKPVKFGGL